MKAPPLTMRVTLLIGNYFPSLFIEKNEDDKIEIESRIDLISDGLRGHIVSPAQMRSSSRLIFSVCKMV